MSETATQEGPLAPEQAAEAVRAGAQLVDVRGADEHEAAHIAGDRHIPFDRLKDEVESLDRDKPVLLYCRTGDRSGAASDALRASGWQANSIDGGLLDWVEKGLPIEPDGGQVIERNPFPPA